jgi:hypothetical protein
MLTVTFSRDGRTWYGRKLYKIRIERSDGGHLDTGSLAGLDFKAMLVRILEREVAAGRPFQVIDKR